VFGGWYVRLESFYRQIRENNASVAFRPVLVDHTCHSDISTNATNAIRMPATVSSTECFVVTITTAAIIGSLSRIATENKSGLIKTPALISRITYGECATYLVRSDRHRAESGEAHRRPHAPRVAPLHRRAHPRARVMPHSPIRLPDHHLEVTRTRHPPLS